MKKYSAISLVALLVSLNSCTNTKENAKTDLTAIAFATKLNEQPDALLLDVRTAEEFAKGHLEHAKNINWNGNDFDKQVATMDKTQPVFVYCLSGGRSASAAAKMRTDGFKEVYELKGGILKWRTANLPEATSNLNASLGISTEQFEELLNTDKLVLVDFYADWCAPCKKMKPYLDEIANDMAGEVELIRINADDNQLLYKALKIDQLPVLQLYKNKKLTWSSTGYIEKEEVVKQLQLPL